MNQDLYLYRARRTRIEWTRKKRSGRGAKLFDESVSLYQKALSYDRRDSRPYVGLGRLFVSSGRLTDARLVYEEGIAASGGENAHLWQSLAVLEERCGRLREARDCFDAATVADNTHAAAWHGWGMLEQRQGNIKLARDIFIKGVRLIEAQLPAGGDSRQKSGKSAFAESSAMKMTTSNRLAKSICVLS